MGWVANENGAINARILFLILKIANGRYNGGVGEVERAFGEGRRDVCGIRDDACDFMSSQHPQTSRKEILAPSLDFKRLVNY